MDEEQKTNDADTQPESPAVDDVKQNQTDFPGRMKSALLGVWNDRTKPQVYGPVLVAGLLVLAAAAFALFQPDYRLKGDLTWLAETVPLQGTDLYIEAKEPAVLYKLWRESETGSAVTATRAWEALAGGRLAGLQTVLYLLELKAGLTFENPFDFFEESVGLAFAGEHTLLVARTDLSSRLGVALVKALQGKTIYLPGETLVDEKGNRKQDEKQAEAQEENDSGATHVPESLPVLVERREELNNLELTVLQSGARRYYLVLLEEYLFVSDDLKLLRGSLSLAAGLSGDSVGAAEGMAGARESLGRGDGRALVFLSAAGSNLLAPAARLLGGSGGFAAVLRAEDDETASLDTFSVGAARLIGSGKPGGEVWEDAQSYLPGDAALTVLFRDQSPEQLLKALEEGEGGAAVLGKQALEFLKSGGTSAADFDESGVALVWRGFREERKRMLPRVALGLRGDDTIVTKLRAAVFRKTGEDAREFQDVSYLVSRSGKHFRPARVYFGTGEGKAPGFLATDETILRDVINARKGNSPDLSDSKTWDELGDFKAAPLQVVVHLPAAVAALRDFYRLGALRSSAYTEATVTRDIDPFFAPFAAYARLHLAHGLEGPVHGRAILERQ